MLYLHCKQYGPHHTCRCHLVIHSDLLNTSLNIFKLMPEVSLTILNWEMNKNYCPILEKHPTKMYRICMHCYVQDFFMSKLFKNEGRKPLALELHPKIMHLYIRVKTCWLQTLMKTNKRDFQNRFLRHKFNPFLFVLTEWSFVFCFSACSEVICCTIPGSSAPHGNFDILNVPCWIALTTFPVVSWLRSQSRQLDV